MKTTNVLLIAMAVALASCAGTGKGPKALLLDNFEDGDLINSAGVSGIGESNGRWEAKSDGMGTTRVEAEVKDGVLRLSGFRGPNEQPKGWSYAVINVDVAGRQSTDLTGSTGISFKAKSAKPVPVALQIEGIVGGKDISSMGAAHRMRFVAETEWKTETFYWADFEQPSWICPGDNCVGPLTVENIKYFSWAIDEENTKLDFYLDDVKLIYGKTPPPRVPPAEANKNVLKEAAKWRKEPARLRKAGRVPAADLDSISYYLVSLETAAKDPFRDAGPGAIAKMRVDIPKLLEWAAKGKSPYAGKTGKFLKTYRAQADDTLQPYVLNVPNDYDPGKKYPLVVEIHGYMNDMPTEKFASFQLNLPQAGYNMAGIIAVACYGRGNNGYRRMGEEDVLRVIEEVKKAYSIDASRIYLQGGSMGGHGTYLIGRHYPHLFAAISPECGYTSPDLWEDEKKEKEPAWRIPDRATYDDHLAGAVNYRHVPLYIAHGDDDKSVSVEHSRAMVKRLKELGYRHDYLELAGVGHSLWDSQEFREFANRRGDWFMRYAIPEYPETVTYRTGSLKYHRAYWLTLRQFKSHDKPAQAELTRKGNTFSGKMDNVAAFSIAIDPKYVDVKRPVTVKIEGRRPVQVKPPYGPQVTLVVDGGGWKPVARYEYAELEKKPGLQGTFVDVHSGRFLYIYGTAGDDAEDEINRKIATEERDSITGVEWGQYGGKFTVKADTEVTKEDIAGSHLILIGRPASNSITAKIEKDLPIRMQGKGIVAGKEYAGDDLLTRFIYPNPLNRERYVLVYYAVDPGKMISQKGLGYQGPDYMVFRQKVDEDFPHATDNLKIGHFSKYWVF